MLFLRQHSRTVCPAREVICFYCEKVGHFAKVCNKKKALSLVDNAATKIAASVTPHSTIATISNNVPSSFTKAAATVTINETRVKALFYSCSAKSYVNPSFGKTAKLVTFPCTELVSMASSDHTLKIKNHVTANVHFQGQEYKNVRFGVFGVLDSLCNDVILGLNF